MCVYLFYECYFFSDADGFAYLVVIIMLKIFQWLNHTLVVKYQGYHILKLYDSLSLWPLTFIVSFS